MGGVRKETSSWNKRKKFSTYDEYLAANTNAHQLENCFAFGNPSRGFHRNNNPSTEITCTHCGAWNNDKGNFGDEIKIVGIPLSFSAITAEMAIAAKRDANGNLPDIRTLISESPQILLTEMIRIRTVAETEAQIN